LSLDIYTEFYPENSFSGFCDGYDDNCFFNCTDSISTSLNADLGNIRLKYTAHPQTGEPQPLDETEERGSRTPLKNKQGREQNHYYPFACPLRSIRGLMHDGYQPHHDIIGLEGANVTIIPTSPNVGDPYKYKYQGQEWQDELGLNTYAYQWRDYDPAIARFNKIDRFAEKYFDQTPYHFTRNNPLYFVDIAGDSLNVAQFRDYDKTANESLINDLQDKTGLSLETDDDGNVIYESKNGKPVIARNDKGKKRGSRAARKALIKLINSDKKISVDGTEGLTKVDMDGSDPNLILINPNQIENFIKNTSKDLNPTTFGYALNFFHEIGHTDYGGTGQDPPFVFGQNAYEQAGRQERLPNRIRRQLGSSYGQRSSYNPYYIKSAGKSYFPWSQTTLSQLKNNQTPTTKYISVPIGN